MKNRVVSVTEFKAKCLAMLNDIGENGGTITITKRGKPLATVGPAPKRKWKSPEGRWVGKIEIPDGFFEQDRSDMWECVREAEASHK